MFHFSRSCWTESYGTGWARFRIDRKVGTYYRHRLTNVTIKDRSKICAHVKHDWQHHSCNEYNQLQPKLDRRMKSHTPSQDTCNYDSAKQSPWNSYTCVCRLLADMNAGVECTYTCYQWQVDHGVSGNQWHTNSPQRSEETENESISIRPTRDLSEIRIGNRSQMNNGTHNSENSRKQI